MTGRAFAGIASASIEPRGTKFAVVVCFDSLDAAKAARDDVVAAAMRAGPTQPPAVEPGHTNCPDNCPICDLKDAKRYRWLRNGNDYERDAPMVVLYEKASDSGDRPYWAIAATVLDSAVDKAMAASGPTKGEGQ